MISVIIPCYNSEAFVTRAVDSVLNQTFKDIEIILVDNNSTDNTISVLKSLAAQHPQITAVLHESKVGAPAARNKGLSVAKGEWLQFLDSDDEILPNKLAHQIELTKNGNVDLIIGNCFKWRDGQDKSTMRIKRAITDNPWKAILGSRFGNTCNNLWRREFVIAVGAWNEEMTSSDEYELLFRFLKNDARIGYFDLPETIVHMRSDSVNRSKSKERACEILENFVNLRLAIRDYLRDNELLTKELDWAVRQSIYQRLLPYKKRVPTYVNSKFDELQLDIPIQYIIRQRFSRMKHKTVRMIKKKFFG